MIRSRDVSGYISRYSPYWSATTLYTPTCYFNKQTENFGFGHRIYTININGYIHMKGQTRTVGLLLGGNNTTIVPGYNTTIVPGYNTTIVPGYSTTIVPDLQTSMHVTK